MKTATRTSPSPKTTLFKANPAKTTNKLASGWTSAKRKTQSDRTRAQKPWLLSTGPKTETGKKRVARNALKHGQRSARTIRFKRILRQAKKYLAFVRHLNRVERERRRIALGLATRPTALLPSPQMGQKLMEQAAFYEQASCADTLAIVLSLKGKIT